MSAETRTAGEDEFEAYLTAEGYTFEYEKVWPGKSKRPDYTVMFADKEILFDVKDFDPKFPVVGFSQIEMYSGIRRQIEAGRSKFKEFKELTCCVVLRNNGNMFARIEDPHTVLGAMYGDFGFAVPVYVGPGIATEPAPPIRPTFLRNAQMLPDKNTTISALITVRYVPVGRARMGKIWKEFPTLSMDQAIAEAKARYGESFDSGEERRGLMVWENAFARLPLTREIFNGPYDLRFGLDGNDLACVYFGTGLADLE